MAVIYTIEPNLKNNDMLEKDYWKEACRHI